MSHPQLSRREWLVLSAAGLLLPGAAFAVTEAGPPLYIAERAGNRVYILGGAAPGDRSWLTPKIATAIRDSRELWQEDLPDPCPFNRDLNIELGRRPSGQLFDDLDAAQQARVTEIAKRLNYPLDMFQQMRPWAAGAVVAALDRPRALAAFNGDDVNGVIQTMFQDRKLPVRAEVEQCDDRIHFYANFSQSAAVQYLLYQIDLAELPPDLFPKWSEQWLRGDVSGWESFNREWGARYPDLYAVLEAGRNEAWARRITAMLDRGGTYFVHVGIQHTVGPASIQARTKALGINVRTS